MHKPSPLDVVGKEKNFFAGEAFLSPLDVVGKEMRVGKEIFCPTAFSGERILAFCCYFASIEFS